MYRNVQVLRKWAIGVRGDVMAEKINSDSPEALLKRLASSSPNDAVKLLFLEADDISAIEGLDLSLLSEVKRSPSGTVELKFVDKLAVLRELSAMQKEAESESESGASFYAALDKAAKILALEDKNEV